VEPFRTRAAELRDLGALKRLHHHPESGMFLDWGLHTEGVELMRDTPPVRCGLAKSLLLQLWQLF